MDRVRSGLPAYRLFVVFLVFFFALSACQPDKAAQSLPVSENVITDPQPAPPGAEVFGKNPFWSFLDQNRIPEFPEVSGNKAIDQPLPKRLILLGICTGSWLVIRPLLESGQLPNIKKILNRGSYGLLSNETGQPPISWASIVTGKTSALNVAGPDRQFHDQSDGGDVLSAKALWRLLPKQMASRSAIFGFSDYRLAKDRRFEFDQRANGNDACIAQKTSIVMPNNDQIFSTLASELCAFESMDSGALFAKVPHGDLMFHQTFSFFLLAHFSDPSPFDLHSVVTKRAEKEARRAAKFYQGMDAYLSVLAEDRSVLLAIVSDNGMEPNDHNVDRLRFLQRFFQALGVRLDHPDHVQDELSVRAKVGDHEAQVTIRSESRTFPLAKAKDSSELFSGEVIIPVVECHGDNGRDCPELVENRLEELLQKVVVENRRVYGKAEKRDGGLVFKPIPEAFEPILARTKEPGSSLFEIFTDQARHHPGTPGILILAGPNVRQNKIIEGARQVDLAPTLLKLLAQPIAADLDGRILTEVIEPAFLKAHP
jgi:hypothetical protein